MPFSHSFEDTYPTPRYDGLPWVGILVEESLTGADGTWTLISDQAITVDTTPQNPNPVDVTVNTAVLAAGYYRFRFRTAAGVFSPYTTAVFSPRPASQQLVTLADVKNYLSIPATDETHDERLLRAILGVRAVIEDIAGPIIVATFTEWHDGNKSLIQVRHPPSLGFGTSPVLTLVSLTEWSAGAATVLTVAADPSLATSSSVMMNDLGQITRLGAGAYAGTFAGGPRSVRVVYTAGQQFVPANVIEAALELVRVNTQSSQAIGRGRMTVADDTEGGPSLGFFVPRRVRELLEPNSDTIPIVA